MVTVEEFKNPPLSGVLEVALADLTKVRRSKKYTRIFISGMRAGLVLGLVPLPAMYVWLAR